MFHSAMVISVFPPGHYEFSIVQWDLTIDLEYLQAGGQLYPGALNCEPSGFPFPVLLNGLRLRIGEMLDTG